MILDFNISFSKFRKQPRKHGFTYKSISDVLSKSGRNESIMFAVRQLKHHYQEGNFLLAFLK